MDSCRIFHAAILLLGCACSLGCDRFGCEREQASPPPVVRRATGSAEAPGAGVALQGPKESADRAALRRQMMTGTPGSGQDADGTGPEKEEKKRDLEAELRQLVGSPISCMKTRDQKEGPKSISVSVQAVVLPDGAISRAYVSSSSLDAEELECIDRRVEAARLAGPIKDAPRTINATVEIRQAEL